VGVADDGDEAQYLHPVMFNPLGHGAIPIYTGVTTSER
jgi:hypothetical protein